MARHKKRKIPDDACAAREETLFSPEEWTEIRTAILSQSTYDDDHLIWKGAQPSCPEERFPTLKFKNIVRSVPAWWGLSKTEGTSSTGKGHWKAHCDIPTCFEHHLFIHQEIRSVEDLTQDDVTFLLDRIKQWSEEIPDSSAYTIRNPSLTQPCREWQGAKSLNGHGIANALGRQWSASKLVWELHEGKTVERGHCVRHRCLLPSCVEITHLVSGTFKQNAEDRSRDGTNLAGEDGPNATLTNETARAIAMSRGEGLTAKERADMFGTSPQVVTMIDSGRTWSLVMTETERQHLAAHPPRKVREMLSDDDVRAIRQNCANGMKTKQCAQQFGIGVKTVWRIVNRVMYKYVSDRVDTEKDDCETVNADQEAKRKEKIEKTQQRIRRNVTVVRDGDGKLHWLWCLGISKAGYGESTYQGRCVSAHAVSYIVFKNSGERIQKDLQVRHVLCPYRHCVNPDCLAVGTPTDDARDKVLAGTVLRGEKNHKTKITTQLACEIKASKGNGTQMERAKRFNVTRNIVNGIDMGRCWGHIVVADAVKTAQSTSSGV
jgi:predicted DNA-binding protein (UPF0251 family)